MCFHCSQCLEITLHARLSHMAGLGCHEKQPNMCSAMGFIGSIVMTFYDRILILTQSTLYVTLMGSLIGPEECGDDHGAVR